MKLDEIKEALDSLNEIKKFSDKQDYNTSTFINKCLIKVVPLLENEITRMNTEKVEINCAALEVIDAEKLKDSKLTVVEAVNKRIRELVMSDYKIIDFGIFKESITDVSGYIKYTS